MNYLIFDGATEINRITASPSFVRKYCLKHGYTYEEIPLIPESIPEEPPTEQEQMRADLDYLLMLAGGTE